jgi:hypothetical protein
LDLNFVVLADAVDVEQAEAQALHAVGAAGVVDDWEPGFPFAGLVHGALAAQFFNDGEHALAIEVGDVTGFDGDFAGGILEGGCLTVWEGAEQEQGVVVAGQGGRVGGWGGGDSGDGVTLIQQGGQDFESCFSGEGDGSMAFVEHDFEGAGGMGNHGRWS